MFRRIFWPISLAILAVVAFFSWTVVHYTSRIWDAQATSKLARVADVISSDPTLLNPAALVKIKRLIQADILIYNHRGRLVAATVHDGAAGPFMHAIPAGLLKELLDKGTLVVPIRAPGVIPSRQLFKVLNMARRDAVILSLAVSDVERVQLVHEVSWVVGVTAFSALVFLWVSSYQVARFVVEPLENLVDAMARVSSGRWDAVVPEQGPPELVEAAGSFNALVSQLNEYKRRVQEAERAATAGAMAAGLAHEIRNPLTSLKMAAQMLCEFLKDSPAELKKAEAIVREARRLEGILSETLQKSRQEFSREPGDLDGIVRRVGELAEAELSSRGLGISLELAGNLPPLMMDAEKIEQVVWNLVRNAADAMGSQGVVVLRTFFEREPVPRVCLQVDDSGPGLDEDALSQAFKPFFTTKEKGTGLGLAICREIARRHGGELTLQNLPGGGARAELCLFLGEGHGRYA